jgi:hypothetical protein
LLREGTSTAHATQEGLVELKMHDSSKRLCPNCSSVETSRSHRHGAVERYVLRAIGVHPYRCLNCDVRFYAFSRFDEGPLRNNKAA